jgi:hypothetical protein
MSVVLSGLSEIDGNKHYELFLNGKRLFIILILSVSVIIFDAPDLLCDRLCCQNKRRTIDSFSSSDCWNFFETCKEDLYRLIRALRLPDKVVLSNGSTMSGEELLLRGLYELVSGEDQYNIATNIFGRDQSQQSRCFTYFINYIYDNFIYLVTNHIEWWYTNGYLHQSMLTIKRKFGGNDLL